MAARLLKAWKQASENKSLPVASQYLRLVLMAKDLGASASDVETFSRKLAKFQDDGNFSRYIAGLFLSAIINGGKDNDYVIHTTQFRKPLHYLGYENTKNITVKGNAGDCLANNMSKGKITVEGNAGDDVCLCMFGGEVRIKGNAIGIIGNLMKGGEIRVDGETGAIGHVITGKIYQGVKLVHDAKVG